MAGLDGGSVRMPDTILDKASEATKDRGPKYGHPIDHFSRTARQVTAYLQGRGLLAEDARLEWWDWPAIMELDKISRRMSDPRHEDSLVDCAGYARAVEMGWDELDKRMGR